MGKNILKVVVSSVLILQAFGNTGPFCQYSAPVQIKQVQAVTNQSPPCSYNPGTYQSYSQPTSMYTSVLPTLPAESPLQTLKKSSTNPKSKSHSTANPGLDPTVLNNLAIALQLLIVSNMLNTPPEDLEDTENLFPSGFSLPAAMYDVLSGSVHKSSLPTRQSQSKQVGSSAFTVPGQSQPCYSENKYEKQAQTYSQQTVMPNANFVGSFGDSCLITNLGLPGSYGSPYACSPSNPRSSMALMSPYEALGPSSPFSDPFQSSSYGSYGCYGSKNAFQSPYESILATDAANDLFGMDFF